MYTNKPPGGVAYRCSFRVTEAVHAIERMVDILAHEIGVDPAQLRMENFIQPEQFPYKTPTGWEYDSGNYGVALQKAMDMIGYADLRKEQAEKRARGELMGIGISSFTEIVGAGPSKDFDIIGIKMFDSCEIRVHPTGKVIARIGVQTPGPGPRDDVRPDHRRGARLPGRRRQDRVRRHGHRALRARDVRVALDAGCRRGHRDGVPEDPRTRRARSPRTSSSAPRTTSSGSHGKFTVKGSPDRSKTIQEISFAAYTNHPAGDGGGPRGGRLLRPTEPDVPVRELHLRRGHRQGDRPGHGPPVRGGGRLRQHHQPDDRGRPDPRRAHDGLRPVAPRIDHL